MDASKIHTLKAINSVKWSALTELVSKIASPIALVILARILAPDVFGVVASAAIAIGFSQMLWDAGLSKALIQTDADPDDAANVVFWTNVGLGVVVYLGLFFSAPVIASFFNSPATTLVLRVLGLQVIVGSLSSVQQALFVRGLSFRGLFWIKLFTLFIPYVLSIPLALSGYGVWALVAGALAGQVLNLFLLWHYSPWRPKFQYDFLLAKKILQFGFWVLGEGLGSWLIVWCDSVIVGKYFGVHDLGVYTTGIMIVGVIFSFTLNPFLPVLYPTFSRLQHDHSALMHSFHKVVRMVIALAFPIAIGLFLIGQDMVTVVFGHKWEGLGFVVAILGLKEGLNWAVGINAETYRAIGRPDVNTKVAVVQMLYFLPAYFVAAQSGLEVFVYVRMALGLTYIPIQVFIGQRILGLSYSYLWKDGKIAILAATTMGLCLLLLKWCNDYFMISIPHVFLLVLLIASSVTIYLIIFWMFDRPFVWKMLELARRVGSS